MVLKNKLPLEILKDKTFKTRMLRYEIFRSEDGKFKKWKPKIPEMMDFEGFK
jgi:hypothetical protein